MLRELPVREVMVSDVLTFAPGDNVMDAIRTMLVRDVDGAPSSMTMDRSSGCCRQLTSSLKRHVFISPP